MSDEYEEGPDPFMVDLGEGENLNDNVMNLDNEMNNNDADYDTNNSNSNNFVNQQLQSNNSLAFELEAAFGSGSTSISNNNNKNINDKDFSGNDNVYDDDINGNELEDILEDENEINEEVNELNESIESNYKFLNKLKLIDNDIPIIEVKISDIIKNIVEQTKVRDDQVRQLWELDRDILKQSNEIEFRTALMMLDNKGIIKEESEDEDEDKGHENEIPLLKSSMEGVTNNILQTLTIIGELSQITMATLNESGRKTRSIKTILSGIKREDERTEKAKELINKFENKRKIPVKFIVEEELNKFKLKLNELDEYVKRINVLD